MWKPFILCWLLSVLGPSHQGFVGKRHRGPSFEVTERTDTCIDVQWDKHYFKTTGLRLFILRGISMFDKKSVEYRFAAVARDGYLCELEPNTKYTISLIPVTISGTTPETFDLHNVLTLPAVTSQAISGLGHSVDKSAEEEIPDSKKVTDEVASAEPETETSSNTPNHLETITGARPRYQSKSNEKVSSLAMRYPGDSVDNSAEVEIADSTEGTDEVSTEGRKTATLSNSPSLSENITGAIPTVPSESNEKVTSQAISGLRHSVDNSAERDITDSTKGTDEAATAEHETETSSNTPNHLETITGTRPRYRSESIEKVDSLAISNLGESVDNSAEAEITDSTKGKDWVSTEGHGTETLANYSTHSKTITGGSTRVKLQSDGKGAFRQKGFRPAALVVTVCVTLSLLALAIGIIIWVARRSLGRRFNFKLDLVHAEENC
uniref:Fibronectin type-III domain-containing protein n=1 Tax=Schistocephalus solidus TaxID=70667 RepID=A0A0X3QGM5_SCHSO